MNSLTLVKYQGIEMLGESMTDCKFAIYYTILGGDILYRGDILEGLHTRELYALALFHYYYI